MNEMNATLPSTTCYNLYLANVAFKHTRIINHFTHSLHTCGTQCGGNFMVVDPPRLIRN